MPGKGKGHNKPSAPLTLTPPYCVLTTPEPITTTTPELDFAYDAGQDGTYPSFLFFECRRGNEWVFPIGGQAGGFNTGDPGQLAQSGVISIATQGGSPTFDVGLYTFKLYVAYPSEIILASGAFTVS